MVDTDGNTGSAGQVLSTTGTGTQWVNNAVSLSGTVTNSTLRWNGSDWEETQTILQSDTGSATLAANTTVTGTLDVQGASTLATTTLQAGVLDADGDLGTAGQVLSSTGTRTNWISFSNSPRRVTGTSTHYTVDLSESTVFASPTAPSTITLPMPSASQDGETITIKRTNAYNGVGDTLQIMSTAQIEGSLSPLFLNVSYQGYTLQAFNSQWFIIQRF